MRGAGRQVRDLCQFPRCAGRGSSRPLRDLEARQGNTFRLLRPTCHNEASGPTQRRSVNPTISQFNPAAYEAFVRSPRPVQRVAKLDAIDPRREIVNINVRRCRRSCLVNAVEPWPVFCAHDEINRTSELADFNWIDAGLVSTAKNRSISCHTRARAGTAKKPPHIS